MRLPSSSLLLLLLSASGLAAAAPPPPGCDGFTWNVSRELALLASTAEPVTAGDGAAHVARIEPGRLYTAKLWPQAQVALAASPRKPMPGEGAHAGLLAFRVPADGRYRVSITSGHWIDVVDAGAVVPSLAFQGHAEAGGCPLVHKIVEFQLRAGRELLLQFAGASDASAGVAITAVEDAAGGGGTPDSPPERPR